MSDLLTLIFRRMHKILKKNHPDKKEVEDFFRQYLNKNEVVELVLLIDDKGILEATYSMVDIMDNYNMWNNSRQ